MFFLFPVTIFSLFVSSFCFLPQEVCPSSPSQAYVVSFTTIPGCRQPLTGLSRLPWFLTVSCCIPSLLHGRDLTVGFGWSKMYRNRYSVKGIWSGGTKDSGSNICSMGWCPWEGTERIQAKENTEILKIEGDEPKSTMEMRKACLQQGSDWPESLCQKPKRGSNCLDGVWGIVSSYSVTIIIFCLDYHPLFVMQTHWKLDRSSVISLFGHHGQGASSSQRCRNLQ